MTRQLTYVHVNKKTEVFSLFFQYVCLKMSPLTAAALSAVFARKKIISGESRNMLEGSTSLILHNKGFVRCT